MALAIHNGKPDAQHIVQSTCEQAIKSGIDLRQAALENPHVCTVLSPQEIDRALDPAAYLGSTDAFINRALETYRGIQAS